MIYELVAEVGPLCHERHQAGLVSRRRKRTVGAGARHRLVFIDRLLATLVPPRCGTTHDVLACWFHMDRSTVTRAINEVRPLSAERGCTITSDIRLRTLAEVVDHLGARWCSPIRLASCADITHARQLGLVKPLTGRPVDEILADAGYQAHSSRRIRVEHGIAHLKNRQSLARHIGAASI